MNARHTSMRFTVGTLLRHALDAGAPVRVLVEGQWLEGVPLACDETGILLESTTAQSLVRLDAIRAVSLERNLVPDVMGEEGTETRPREAYPAQRRPADHEATGGHLNLISHP